GHAIHADKIRFDDDMHVSGCLLVLEVIGKQIERLLHNAGADRVCETNDNREADRKSTRLNSSHVSISYAVFCLKKKKKKSTNMSSATTFPTTKVKLPGSVTS